MSVNPTLGKTQSLEKIVTPSALIIIDGDVVTTYMNSHAEFSDDSANENAEAVWDFVAGKRVFHLIVPDPTTLITIEARNYKNERFESVKRAEAIVIKTLGHRLLAQFYMNVRANECPVKIFDSEAKAIEWFDSIRSN